MIVKERWDMGLGCLKPEAAEHESQVQLSLFGSSVEELIEREGNEGATRLDAVLSNEIAEIFVYHTGTLMKKIDNKIEHFALKDDLVVHVNSFFLNTRTD
jgi:hypothetical protein